MTLFEAKQPAARAIPSTFGGGWIIPLTPDGSRVLGEYFDAEPQPIAPLGGLLGYIIEPQDGADVAEYLRAEGIAWEVGS